MVAAEEKEAMAAAPGDATVKPGGGVVQAPSQLQAPRPEMIATAVRFLENRKVQETTPELKTTFLKKKGLTDEEVTLAFQELKLSSSIPASQQQPPVSSVVYLPQTSIGTRLRDLLNLLLLIGGFSYSVKFLWKKYIRRWFYGEEKDEEPTPSQLVYQTSQQLLAALTSLQHGVNSLQESLEGLKGKGDGEMSDVKKEIQSVKGLLLSSRSFPGQPTLAGGSPSIPAWQLAHSPKSNTVAAVDTKAASGGDWSGSGGSTASEIEILNHDNTADEFTGAAEGDNAPAVVQDNLVQQQVTAADIAVDTLYPDQSNELD